MVKNLRKLRVAHRLSQERLAILTGMTKSRIYTYETKDQEPDISSLIILANFFGVTLDYLVGREEEFYAQKGAGTLDLSKLGERIMGFRLQRNLSQEDLAQMVGLKLSYIKFIENGTKIPKLETCLRILNALEAPFDAIFMDSLITAKEQRAIYLQHTLSDLSLEDHMKVIQVAEELAKAYKQRNKVIKSNKLKADNSETTKHS